MYFYGVKFCKMKYIIVLSVFLAIAVQGKSQSAPKVYDPCQQLDTNTIKQLIIGTWVDVNDTSHVLTINEDTLTEKIVIQEGGENNVNISYFSYKFTDNIFSSDSVTCYSIVEYVSGAPGNTDFAINSITHDYLLLGSTGKMVFKRKK